MKAVLVVKRTRLETASPKALALIKAGDIATGGWQVVHDAHCRTVESVNDVLAKEGVSCHVVRDPYRSFDVQDADMVIVVGGDGTFLAASHSVGPGLPILGVNSDPETSRGFFCAANAKTFRSVLSAPIAGFVSRMEVLVNDEVRSKRVLNEALMCHPHPAATSRLSFNFGDSDVEGWEKHVSSGAWVGPPAGTTGAIRSAGGDVLPLGSELLEFVSREAISGATRKYVTPYRIRAIVKNDEAAVYMDGPYKYATLALGDEVEFRISEESLSVVGLDARR